VKLARLPDSITRVIVINHAGNQQLPGYRFFALKVKLPGLISHPEDSGGTINRQSAIKQLQKPKELHHEKEQHLSKSKSTTS
jgi:hypothetical protein